MIFALLSLITSPLAEASSNRSVAPHYCGHTNLAHQEQEAGAVKKSEKGGVEMVYVPAGEFTMGNDELMNEVPKRKVYLDGYWIGKNVVTVAQFREFCKATNYAFPWDDNKPTGGWKDDHPIVAVTWDEARAFCKWAGGDLPTEAQWEKAARGTDGRKFPWGETFDGAKIWPPKKAPDDGPSAVGSFPLGASPYGCLDLTGNVSQWCFDKYSHYGYKGLPDRNPTGWVEGVGPERAIRGGAWGARAIAGYNRCSARYRYQPDFRFEPLGFRLASGRQITASYGLTFPTLGTKASIHIPCWVVRQSSGRVCKEILGLGCTFAGALHRGGV